MKRSYSTVGYLDTGLHKKKAGTFAETTRRTLEMLRKLEIVRKQLHGMNATEGHVMGHAPQISQVEEALRTTDGFNDRRAGCAVSVAAVNATSNMFSVCARERKRERARERARERERARKRAGERKSPRRTLTCFRCCSERHIQQISCKAART